MSNNTIVIKGDGVRQEALANAQLYPGNLVELISTGKVQLQATEKLDVARAFAVEDDLQGKLISDVYAADALVQYNTFNRGDEVLAVLEDGQDVDIGDALESAGAGQLQVYTNGVKLAIAKEALNLSATGFALADRRIIVEIL